MRSCATTIMHMTVRQKKGKSHPQADKAMGLQDAAERKEKKNKKKKGKKRRKQFTCLMHKSLVQNSKTTYALFLCPFRDFVSVCLVAGRFCVCVCGASPDALALPATVVALCSAHLARSPRRPRRSLSHLCKQGKHTLIQRVYLRFKLPFNKYQLPY